MCQHYCLLALLVCFAHVESVAGLHTRIVGGSRADIVDFPYQASISHSVHSRDMYCGAVIVHASWAVTSAHCVYRRAPGNTFLFAGSSQKSNNDHNIVHIEQIYIHPNYSNEVSFPNDIAMLKLSDSLPTNAAAVALPSAQEVFYNQNCSITGWGRVNTGFETTVTAEYLQVAYTSPITEEQCAASGWGQEVRDNMHLCVQSPTAGACNGDSGGPVVCQGKLVGVTSYAAVGCFTDRPTVTCRVTTYVDWINCYLQGNINCN